MTENKSDEWLCPKCGAAMLNGSLTVTVDPVQVVTLNSFIESELEALICSVCGFIELRAAEVENLTREDISEEDLAEL